LQINDDQRGARRIKIFERMRSAAAGIGRNRDLVHGPLLSSEFPIGDLSRLTKSPLRRNIPFELRGEGAQIEIATIHAHGASSRTPAATGWPILPKLGRTAIAQPQGRALHDP